VDGARKAGSLGFFPNSCTWSSRIALGHVVLVGDAAGALDPTQGLGTSLLFRDVRTLSDLLTADRDWERADERVRETATGVLRGAPRPRPVVRTSGLGGGPEADRRRELNAAARERDPTLGGFATLEACGPDGLVPDEAARRIYLGE